MVSRNWRFEILLDFGAMSETVVVLILGDETVAQQVPRK
jgi:hypothetical protein